MSLSKTWQVKEGQDVKFFWQVYNVTNAVRFDAAGAAVDDDLVDITAFGKLDAIFTTPRRMEFGLRYSF